MEPEKKPQPVKPGPRVAKKKPAAPVVAAAKDTVEMIKGVHKSSVEF
jgi:hypothetical protein